MKKTALALCLLFVIVAIIPLTQLANSEISTTKPSIPEFTVKLVEHSYDVPTITAIDPYTGKNFTSQYGYHVENKSIEVTIKNQPFTPYAVANGHDVNLYYNVHVKGHFGKDWTEKYSSGTFPTQSSSEYTVLSLSADYPSKSEVDFQVEAIFGHYYTTGLADHPFYPAWEEFSADESSGWSPTQTLTMTQPQETEPAIQQSEPFPTAFAIAVFGTAVALIGAGLIVYFKKRKPQAELK